MTFVSSRRQRRRGHCRILCPGTGNRQQPFGPIHYGQAEVNICLICVSFSASAAGGRKEDEAYRFSVSKAGHAEAAYRCRRWQRSWAPRYPARLGYSDDGRKRSSTPPPRASHVLRFTAKRQSIMPVFARRAIAGRPRTGGTGYPADDKYEGIYRRKPGNTNKRHRPSPRSICREPPAHCSGGAEVVQHRVNC